MKGFITDLEDRTEANRDFRRVIYTGPHLQLVLMSLEPGEEIGLEVHATVDQFIRVEEGHGEVRINDRATEITDNTAIVVEDGTPHNPANTGQEPLKM